MSNSSYLKTHIVSVGLIIFLVIGNAFAKEKSDETFQLPELNEPGEILIDKWGIPHIYAQNLGDAYFLQGFSAARDRLWQIDHWRRRGLGLLSEVYGPKYAKYDRAAKLFLYRGDLAKEWLAYGPDGKKIIEAFAAGVNAYLKQIEKSPHLMPVEFRRGGFKPAIWSPRDLVRIRSHGIALNVFSEIERVQTICQYGEKAEALRVKLQPEWSTNQTPGIDICEIPENVLSTYFFSRRAALSAKDLPSSSGGSNNWAISAEKSATGRAVIANDPHRPLGLPALRYLSHVETPEFAFAGAGEPFAPGISIGHNGHVAFGLTVHFIDQEDLYVYDLNPENLNEYRYRDGWEEIVTLTEKLPVRGEGARNLRLRFTRHGPIIHEDLERNRAYAVRSMQLEPGNAPYIGSLNFIRAKNVQEFNAKLTSWGGPGENMVFADLAGNIAWQVAGFVPRRPNWDGLWPVLGDGTYEWSGIVPLSQMPSNINPKEGWIATANEMNFPKNYPYRARRTGFEWVDSARAERIKELLTSEETVPFSASLNIQNDFVSLPARELVTRLRGVQTTDHAMQRLIDQFAGWTFDMTTDSEPAALYAIWFRNHLPEALFASIVGKTKPPKFRMHATVIRAIIADPLLETKGVLDESGLDALLLSSLKEASETLSELTQKNGARVAWGDIQKLTLQHPLESALENDSIRCASVFNQAMGGTEHTVNVAYSGPDYKVITGSAPRIVMDVGNWNNTRIMNVPGQSGNPHNPHYCDLGSSWLNGEYIPFLFSRDAVQQATVHRITIEPKQ